MNFFRVTLAAVILFLFLPFLYAFGFCFPRGDDFDGITRASFLFDLPGAFYEIAREWFKWSGRYVYHFLAVFLGHAAEYRALYGLVCAASASLYAAGVWRACRLLGVKPFASLLAAALCTLVLFANYRHLPDFYLLTDSLTIILQGALFLLFFVALLDFILNNRGYKTAVFLIILTVGAYEYSAVGTLCCLCAAHFLLSGKSPVATDKKDRSRGLISLLVITGVTLCVSFLAPGNFTRKSARSLAPGQLWEQISNVPGAWLDFIGGFFVTYGPTVACLSILALLLVPNRRRFPALALVSLLAWLCFSLALFLLQAATDAPFGSSPKFAAAQDIYLALALFVIVYAGSPTFGLGARARFALVAVLVVAALIQVAASENFRVTAINAANGRMVAYADFMNSRAKYLAQISAPYEDYIPARGLRGEARDHNLRAKFPPPQLPVVTVPAWPYVIFPIRVLAPLPPSYEDWPNKWAAWTYGVGKIRAAPPNPAEALALAAAGEGVELIVPKNPDTANFGEIRLENTLSLLATTDQWLTFSAPLAVPARILRPSPPDWRRLLPLPLQKFLLERVLAEKTATDNFLTNLVCEKYDVRPTATPFALWLGPANRAAPTDIFIAADGSAFFKLTPYK